MQCLNKSRVDSFNLENCFGFNEDEINLSICERSSISNIRDVPLEFQSDKPFRLSLYVKPIEHKRLQRNNRSIVQNATEKNSRNKNHGSVLNTQLSEKKKFQKCSRISKNLNVMLFDENVKPENVSKIQKKTPEKSKIEQNITVEVSLSRKNVLKEINTKSFSKTKQNKIRKSYERKFREEEKNENIPEPPSEEILKELEMKKLTRTKRKKTVKEEQEFEKWANNINSDFDDVEKFELSIAYD